MELKTKRLILRPLRNSDAKSIAENVNNLDVSKWLVLLPYPYKLKDAKDWIKNTKKDWRKKKKTDFTFGIELKEEKEIIGGIGLSQVDKFQGIAEVGYWIGKKYWRRGYGSEALKAVLDFGFKKLKLRKIKAKVCIGNTPSSKLLEKFGAKKEGMRRESCRSKADKKIRDDYMYGLLKREYKG